MGICTAGDENVAKRRIVRQDLPHVGVDGLTEEWVTLGGRRLRKKGRRP